MPPTSRDKWQVLGCGPQEDKKGGLSQSSLPVYEPALALFAVFFFFFLQLTLVGNGNLVHLQAKPESASCRQRGEPAQNNTVAVS